MYLKNLTVLGFKSFADKTSLNFQPGVTAIVGPNGCGKSNVSDAIRWVLGEQSAKALRGGEMADVIFNGTDGRKPLGMAEVSLTIGGVDEDQLRAAGVEIAYNEVTITRRVFRDGGSEYFINKTSCRLKDIQQLFMGTGVGRTSYSILAQGNITQILSSKPEDRRLIFEEAAGITKFKAQKKESLRKLEYTEQNLLRVADLVREVKRQIGSLQRQAGKARRYKQLAQDLQQLDTQHARHQFDVLQTEIRDRETAANEMRDGIETNAAAVLRCEDEITQLRQRLSELEHEIAGLQQRGLELKSEIDRNESRVHFNEERLKEVSAQDQKAMADIAQADERRQAAEQDLASLKERLAVSEAALSSHREALQEKQDGLRGLEEELRRLQETLRQAQSAAFAATQNLNRARNEAMALEMQQQGNVVRLEKLSAEKIQLEEERVRLEARLGEFAAGVEAEKVGIQTQRGTVEERQQRLREVLEELTKIAREQDALLQQQAEKRSRLNVLEQLEAGHEGFSAGAVAALKQSEHVLGSVADRLRVPDQFITAIETALGHHLQVVLTEQPEAAQNIIRDLTVNKRGRASIAPMSFVRGGETAGSPEILEPSPVELNGVPLEATAVVGCDSGLRPLIQNLLGNTRIVRDLESATAAWRENPGTHEFVTLTGEMLSRHGVYTGGSGSGNPNTKAPGSILGRKNQMAELRALLENLAAQVAEVSRRRGGLQSEQTELQAGLQEAQTELRAREVAVATHEGEVRALRNSERLLEQKIETVVYEIGSLAAQEREGLEKRAALTARASELEGVEQVEQGRVSETNSQLEALRQQRDAANAGLTESRVALATEEQMCSAFQQQQRSLEQRLRELDQVLAQRRNEISSAGQRRQTAELEIQEARGRIEKTQHERELLNEQVAALLDRKRTQETDITGREEALRQQRRVLEELQQRRGSLQVELAQKTMSVENLRERIQQKYHLNLEDIRSECITITFADEGQPKVHVMSPEEMAAAGAATDWDAIATQVQSLQQRLDEMGPVNLVAIEEYEETEQRFQFLSKQHDDLVQAKVQLLEVINRINHQTRDMFRETFERIRDKFRTMFTEIFGGGKADLVLMDENDLLESGIEIVARPPGKQLQTISLLSGGEQTMTAVALLFSIYQVKPSPFCVLDELDAPLDESNINRFIRVLQGFLVHSQFIIITHNKRTIGIADVLYGVTMQEQGVSRIVSVKFHKNDEQGPESKGTPLDTPTAIPQVVTAEDSPHQGRETMEVSMAK
jgi:chromosome segregation protein